MSEKTREICTVVSQESIGAGIYSMWIQTDRIAADAKPGQFVSLYTNDKSKILPRPISLCEIDKENGRLHLVYRVTGQGTGTDEFSQMKAGDTIPVLGPLGNGFPVEKAEGKKVFLMGGGIGVPPILELAKQMKCEKKQIIAGYRTMAFWLWGRAWAALPFRLRPISSDWKSVDTGWLWQPPGPALPASGPCGRWNRLLGADSGAWTGPADRIDRKMTYARQKADELTVRCK